MPSRSKPLSLSSDDQCELREISSSRSLAAGDVLRARMILMLAAGHTYAEIQQRLETTAPTISRWRKRFLESGVAGLLETRHPGQKPTVLTPKLQARVLDATRRKPKDGSTLGRCASWRGS
jgi:transposase